MHRDDDNYDRMALDRLLDVFHNVTQDDSVQLSADGGGIWLDLLGPDGTAFRAVADFSERTAYLENRDAKTRLTVIDFTRTSTGSSQSPSEESTRTDQPSSRAELYDEPRHQPDWTDWRHDNR